MSRSRTARGRRSTLSLERRPEQGEPVTVGSLPTMFVRVESERKQTPGGKTAGVIRFNVWMAAVDALFQQAVDRFRAFDGIIIDLRGNPGGLAGMMMGTSGHFVGERKTLGVMKTRENELRFFVNPRLVSAAGERVQPYAGPVAILVDAMSGSASECFAGGMQSIGRVRVFGQPSMGQALPALFDKMPNGDVLIHAYGDFVTAEGTRLEGRGVIPDEVVPLVRADLLAGRDRTLEMALAWIDRPRDAAPAARERWQGPAKSDYGSNVPRVRHRRDYCCAGVRVSGTLATPTANGPFSSLTRLISGEFMEQRPLRLGDILDDYCPRERRLTNHAIVAMIEDDIRQTRCTTCDAEHAYKGGKVPKRRKKETPAALYKEVLAGMPDSEAAPILSSAGHVAADGVAADGVAADGAAADSVASDPVDANNDADADSADAAVEPVVEAAPQPTLARPAVAAVPAPVPPAAPLAKAAAPSQPVGERTGRSRGGSCSQAVDSSAASEDRRAEGRAAAAGIHDPSGDARPRAFPRRRSPHEAAAPGRAGQRQRQPSARRTALRRIAASGAGPWTGRPRRSRTRRVPRRSAAASRRRQEALALTATRPSFATASHFNTAYFVVKSAENGRLCR